MLSVKFYSVAELDLVKPVTLVMNKEYVNIKIGCDMETLPSKLTYRPPK